MTPMAKQNLSLFLRLLTPSRSGALLSAVIGIMVVLAIMTPRFYEMINVDFYVSYIADSPSDIIRQSEEASTIVNSSKFAADASVFVVWSIAGLIGYALVAAIARSLRNTREFIQELEYSERHRKDVEREALIHAILRIAAACCIALFYLTFMNVLLPLVVVFVHAALASPLAWAVLYITLAAIITILSVHISVVLGRLALLRTRIFFS